MNDRSRQYVPVRIVELVFQLLQRFGKRTRIVDHEYEPILDSFYRNEVLRFRH
jgi:hypothetical protein